MFDFDHAQKAFIELLDGMTPLIDACLGYKAKLVTAGFAPEIAEEMVVHFHEMLINGVMKTSGS